MGLRSPSFVAPNWFVSALCERFLSGPFGLVAVFFCLLFFLHIQNPVYILFCFQQLPHFLTGAPVLGVGFFLFLQELGVLGLQLFDLGQLLDTHIIKGVFRRLVEQNFFLMFLAEFLGVTGLSVGYIGLTGLGIVERSPPCVSLPP